MIVRAVTQEPPHQDARRIGEVVRPSNGGQVQVLMGAVEAVEPPPSSLGASYPACKASPVQILAPMGGHHHVGDAAVEPTKAPMLNFCVHGAPALAQAGQAACQRHERRVHRDHAVRPGTSRRHDRRWRTAARRRRWPLQRPRRAAPTPRDGTGDGRRVARTAPELPRGRSSTACPVCFHPAPAAQAPARARDGRRPSTSAQQGWRQRHIGPPT